MMDLLNIWRNSPEITGINANDFIKSFVDRIKASLAFLHLLCKLNLSIIINFNTK